MPCIGGRIESIPVLYEEFDYPLGIKNYKTLFNKKFDFEEYKKIRFIYYVGSLECEVITHTIIPNAAHNDQEAYNLAQENALYKTAKGMRNVQKQMILFAFNKMQKIQIDKVNPYSVEDLKKIHGILTFLIEKDAGKFRNHGECIRDGDRIIFVAPPQNMVNPLMN